jgi:AraC-like DNA-binding protein
MLEHYDKNLSVSDWATLSGHSLSTFNRKFKKRYNTSPKQWLLEHNMKLADEALRSGLSVSECATEFGYNNTSNFIKAFSKIYKSTPKQYTMS